MQLGFVGLGRMGYSMALRLLERDHGVFVYDSAPDKISSLARFGAIRSGSLVGVVEQLARPRHVWIMVPSHAVDSVLDVLVNAAQAITQKWCIMQ